MKLLRLQLLILEHRKSYFGILHFIYSYLPLVLKLNLVCDQHCLLINAHNPHVILASEQCSY